MIRNGIRIRWITVTCFEVQLPSGKTILFDPWIGTGCADNNYRERNLEVGLDDLSGADWMFISHAHFDHCEDVQLINAKFMEGTNGGRIFLPALSAYAIAQRYDIPYRDILPVYPWETFDFDEFTITALPCRHRGDPIPPSKERARDLEWGLNEIECFTHDIGNLDELDWAVTIKENNMRFMVMGGGLYHFNNTPEYAKKFGPLFVTRQVSHILCDDPQVYAKYVAAYHAPFVFPSHHEGLWPGNDYQPFVDAVNKILKEMGSGVTVLNQERGKWYEIGAYLEQVD